MRNRKVWWFLSRIMLFYVPTILQPMRLEAAGAALVRQGSFDLLPRVKLEVRASPFIASRHRIERCPAPYEDNVCTIDGKVFFGTDGDLPSTQLDSMVLQIGGQRADLDISGMFEPWVDRPRRESFTASETDEGLGIYKVVGTFSDGAGFYVAEWLVTAHGSVRTLLTHDEHIIDCTSDEPA